MISGAKSPGPVKVKRMRYCCMGASMSGENRHAQTVMKDLGISYQHATPQSMADQWWFWCPESLSDDLPSFLSVDEVDPMASVGRGLNEQTAKMLTDHERG